MFCQVANIRSGFLAVPVLTGSSAYTIAESFYAVIAISTFVGALINLIGINPPM